jgi:hypothetical protein
MTRLDRSDVHPLARQLHPIRLAAAHLKVVTVHTPTMTTGRWIFLVVLAAFFCTVFVATYVWMRRPRFGDGSTSAFTGLEKTTEEGRPALLRTAAQRARTTTVEEKSAAGVGRP